MILAYTDCFLGDVINLLEILTTLNKNQPNSPGEKIHYVTRIYSLYGGSITSPSTTLMNVETQAVQVSRQADIDILIIAHGPQQAISTPPDSIIHWLRKICFQSRCVIALGTGIFWLAASGVLNQRTVTTHSSLIARLIACYPTLRVKQNADLQQDGKFYTASEHVNIKEMAQLLLRSDRGEITTDGLTTGALKPPHLDNASCLLDSVFTHTQSIAHRIILWWLTHIDEDLNTAQSACYLAMSERNFRRHFKLQMGYSPSLFLLLLRLELSRQALINSNLPIDKIARRCGLRDGQQLARIFRKFIGTSPHQYREVKYKEHFIGLNPVYSDLFNAVNLPGWLCAFLANINPEKQKKLSILLYLQYQPAIEHS
ncbi:MULTISPECIES: helix-turn-helix domain-containing protein [unclassified Brenneria]|uniref:helix-turn-helix domain-containing protein n=1 Tax=unclassified Brenneria TaxID=2634434 RepID=UPI0018F07CFD|nr:helix-turn-helix domain-containing protein [Brenneria sp. L3-3C-1]MEE3644952.1 helix-turn-helix domain-containing protein [Brenneria sp. L3_3C_1]